MKVSSAPFEAPIGHVGSGPSHENAAKSLADKASPHLVSAPTGNANVKAGLDAATKDALLRLANLAKEKEQEREREDAEARENPAKRLISKTQKSSGNVISSRDVDAIEAVREFEPESLQARLAAGSEKLKSVEKARIKFEAARKQLGRKVYKEAVKRQAIVELEKQFNLDLNVEDLESLTDVSLMEDSGKLENLNFSGVGLKRVA